MSRCFWDQTEEQARESNKKATDLVVTAKTVRSFWGRGSDRVKLIGNDYRCVICYGSNKIQSASVLLVALELNQLRKLQMLKGFHGAYILPNFVAPVSRGEPRHLSELACTWQLVFKDWTYSTPLGPVHCEPPEQQQTRRRRIQIPRFRYYALHRRRRPPPRLRLRLALPSPLSCASGKSE